MNGFVLLETTTGSPVHFSVWKEGFGVNGLRSHVDPRITAISIAGLLSGMRIKEQFAFGDDIAGDQLEFCGGGVRVVQKSFPSANMMSIVSASDEIPTEVAQMLAKSIGEKFLEKHEDAIENAAKGVIKSYKKSMRPLVATTIWDSIQTLNNNLLAVSNPIADTPWIATVYSPDLSSSIRKSSCISYTKSDTSIVMRDIVASSVLSQTNESIDISYPLPWMQPTVLEVFMPKVLQVALTALRLNSTSLPLTPCTACIKVSENMALVIFTLGDFYFILPTMSSQFDSTLLSHVIDAEGGALREMLKFASENTIPAEQ